MNASGDGSVYRSLIDAGASVLRLPAPAVTGLFQALASVGDGDEPVHVAQADVDLGGRAERVLGLASHDLALVVAARDDGQARQAAPAAQIAISAAPAVVTQVCAAVRPASAEFDRVGEAAAAVESVGHHRLLAVLVSALGAGLAADRGYLANLLHDGPVQDLTAAQLMLDSALLAGEPDPTGLERVLSAVQGAVRSLRGLMRDLAPPDDEDP